MPFTTALPENSKFAALAGRIIHNSRAVRYELWCGPQCVRNFLGVRCWHVLSHVLSARCLSAHCEHSEETKCSQLHYKPPEGFIADGDQEAGLCFAEKSQVPHRSDLGGAGHA